jgi:branched-chain amino acid aminotransferase
MAKLQRPALVYMGGRLRPWDEAVLHVGCEAATRGLNVFEGLKGYWRSDGAFGILMVRQHYERLRRSARLLHIPFDTTFEQYDDAIQQVTKALLTSDRDMWFRTTLFVTEGHWGEGTVADLVITGYHAEMRPPEPVRLGVSTWRRSVDLALPARAKSGANYQVARLARIEGRAHGYDDMVLLNQEGRVAEATGAAVLMVRDGTVYTPPATEGALESITVDLVEALARTDGINFVRRPIDRTELLVADELAVCGTLAEVAIVSSIEGYALAAPRTLLPSLQAKYFDAARAIKPHPAMVASIAAFEHTAAVNTSDTGSSTEAPAFASPRSAASA